MHYLSGNRVTLLRNGAEFFPALTQAIDEAQFDIAIQTYIYAADVTGCRISDALIRAAQRGVNVHLLLDGFGSYGLEEAEQHRLTVAGVHVVFFRKFRLWHLRRWRIRRMHRKVTVVDGKKAFVGGINIIDDLNVPHAAQPRVDYAVMVEGPLVAEIAESVQRFWRKHSWGMFNPIVNTSQPYPRTHQPGKTKAAFVVRDNLIHRHSIEQAYLQAVALAKQEIWIANAYFFPRRRFLQGLIDAANRGVRVTLLLQGRPDHALLQATYMFYPALITAKIRVIEYRKSFMHSKVAVIDGNWATVGSSNIDPLSLMLAYEANVFVMDAAFAQTLKTDIEMAVAQGGHEITEANWKQNHSLSSRYLRWFYYLLLRLMVSLIRRDF